MKKTKLILFIPVFLLMIFQLQVLAQSPVVENVKFSQRTDGSLLVDIYYDVYDSHGGKLEITLQASDDNGQSWDLRIESLTGHIGDEVAPGQNRHVIWDFYKDNPNISGDQFKVRVAVHENLCGAKIDKDLVLTSDLKCNPVNDNALWVVAPNVTIDLNGYKIWTGNAVNRNCAAIWILQSDGVHIKNGRIEKGFGWGIAVDKSENALIEDIYIRNLEYDDPVDFIMGITTGEAHGIVVRNCTVEFLPTTHKEAFVFGSTQNFLVDSCEVISGSLGVNFGGDIVPTNGIVQNSIFRNCYQSGILAQNTTYGLIKNNEFLNCEEGIETDAIWLGEVSGLHIENNLFRDGFIGIHSMAGVESIITGNDIQNCFRGIMMLGQMGCPDDPPWTDCFFSTDNTIQNNIVINNGIDLLHHPLALGNTWLDNECETSQGVEIPPCNPVTATALEHINELDSVAQEIAEDAALIFAGSWHTDTTGNAFKWVYIYESENQDEEFEIWYKNGEIILKDSLVWPWLIGEENDPLPENCINSDSVMVLTEEMGGAQFREEFELDHIETVLQGLWTVRYVAQDSTLTFWIDPH